MKNIFVAVLVFISLSSQAQTQKSATKGKETYQQTANGLKYIIYKPQKGVKPKMGDVVICNLSYSTEKDSLLFTNKDFGQALQIPLGKNYFKADINEALALCSTGDSIKFLQSADSVFEKNFGAEMPSFIRKGSDLIFRAKVIEITNEAALQAKATKEAEAKKGNQIKDIEKYIADNKLTAITLPSGLRYVVLKEGEGAKPAVGKQVTVHYRGTLLDGTKFDASYDRNEPFKFTLGVGQVIKGWDEGIALLNKGAKYLLIIPSDLGYGAQGAGGIIKPYSPLVFEVEMLDFEQ